VEPSETTRSPSNVVFVFGSNLAGRHGKGAALEARNKWGAEYGIGEGRTGNAYALPTKDAQLKALSLDEIEQSYIRFWKYAFINPDIQFLLTPCGAGLAGYPLGNIKHIYQRSGGFLRNVWLTGDWFVSQRNS
jgi:hypothetical protein